MQIMLKIKILLSALFITASLVTFGQVEKGIHMVGGVFQFDWFANEGTDVLKAELAPNYGYFIGDKISVGGKFIYSLNDLGETSVVRFEFSPSARFYFADTGQSWFFAQASVGGGNTRLKADGEADNIGVFRYDVGVGVDIFLGKKLALEIGLLYIGSKLDIEDADFGSRISFGVGLQGFLGNRSE